MDLFLRSTFGGILWLIQKTLRGYIPPAPVRNYGPVTCELQRIQKCMIFEQIRQVPVSSFAIKIWTYKSPQLHHVIHGFRLNLTHSGWLMENQPHKVLYIIEKWFLKWGYWIALFYEVGFLYLFEVLFDNLWSLT